MSTNSTDKELSKLQQDAPVNTLPKLSNTTFVSSETTSKAKIITDTTKPFFLYPKDGLYGLL